MLASLAVATLAVAAPSALAAPTPAHHERESASPKHPFNSTSFNPSQLLSHAWPSPSASGSAAGHEWHSHLSHHSGPGVATAISLASTAEATHTAAPHGKHHHKHKGKIDGYGEHGVDRRDFEGKLSLAWAAASSAWASGWHPSHSHSHSGAPTATASAAYHEHHVGNGAHTYVSSAVSHIHTYPTASVGHSFNHSSAAHASTTHTRAIPTHAIPPHKSKYEGKLKSEHDHKDLHTKRHYSDESKSGWRTSAATHSHTHSGTHTHTHTHTSEASATKTHHRGGRKKGPKHGSKDHERAEDEA